MTAKLPAGQGMWPAIWLYGGTDPGELDILESVGGGNTAYQTVHATDGSQNAAQTTNTSFTTSYHAYGLLWTPTSVSYYIDGVKTGSWNVAISKPMYMMIDLDVAGPNDWGGPPNASTPTTTALDISSVQIYQSS